MSSREGAIRTGPGGKVLKLSNLGWSANERFLKMDSLALSYFSKTQAEEIEKAKTGERKPKKSIGLNYII